MGRPSVIHQKNQGGVYDFFQGDVSYNAYDRDIAIITIFFGDLTVFGKFSVAQTIFLITN